MKKIYIEPNLDYLGKTIGDEFYGDKIRRVSFVRELNIVIIRYHTIDTIVRMEISDQEFELLYKQCDIFKLLKEGGIKFGKSYMGDFTNLNMLCPCKQKHY